MSRDDLHFRLRIPADIKAAIAASAAANNRSMTAEIIARLSGDQRTLRDWFAGQALASMGGRLLEAAYEAGASRDTVPSDIAIVVFGIADAMLAERERGGAS